MRTSLVRLRPAYAGLDASFVNVKYSAWGFWGVVMVGIGMLGNAIDQNERDRTARFRDKSQLFGQGHIPEGKKSSWGGEYKPWIWW